MESASERYEPAVRVRAPPELDDDERTSGLPGLALPSKSPKLAAAKFDCAGVSKTNSAG